MFSLTGKEMLAAFLGLLLTGCAGTGVESTDAPSQPDGAAAVRQRAATAVETMVKIRNASWPEVIKRAEYYARLASKCKIHYTLGQPNGDSAGREACARLQDTEAEARANNLRARELAESGDKSGVDEYRKHVESMVRDFADIRHAQQSLRSPIE